MVPKLILTPQRIISRLQAVWLRIIPANVPGGLIQYHHLVPQHANCASSNYPISGTSSRSNIQLKIQKLSPAAIAGIVAGAIAFLTFGATVLWFLMKRGEMIADRVKILD